MRLLLYYIKGKILYKGQVSRSCGRVNKFAGCHLRNRLAIAQGKRAIMASKPQQVKLTQSNFFTFKQNLNNLMLFTSFAKFAMAWNFFIDRWKRIQTSSNNFLNLKLSFPLRKLNVPTQFTLFFNSGDPRRNEEINFQFNGHKAL